MVTRKASTKKAGLPSRVDNMKQLSPDLDEHENEEEDDDLVSEAGNSRLSDLLKTIKHLSGNWWEVDLAKILDEYIDIISRIQVTIDGGATTIDFSKASYIVQNMANAYSKKVDLLLQLVEKIRDDLRVYTIGDNPTGEKNADGKPKRTRKCPQRLGFQAEDFNMDFEREVGPAANKNVRRVDPQEARQNARSFPFIALTPWYLSNQNTSSVSDGDAPGANKTPLQAPNGDMIGYIEDFRVNRPFESTSGFVGYNFLDDDPQGNLPCNPLILSTQPPVSQLDASQPPHSQPEDELPMDVSLPLDGDAEAEFPDPPDFGGDLEGDAPEPPPQEKILTERDGNARRNEPRKKAPPPIPVKPKIEPWARFDPYEKGSDERPTKPGKTTLLPDGLKQIKGEKLSQSSTINGVHSKVQRYIQSLLLSKQHQNISAKLQKVMVLEFAAESASNLAETERRAKKLRKQTPANYEFDAQEPDLEEDLDRHEDFDDMLHDPGLMRGDPFTQDDGPLPDDNNVFEALQHSRLNATLKEEESISYENLVQLRVAEYMAQAQEYLQRTDLAKRVAEWHETVMPRLEASEKQRHFDIHEYGTMVLDGLTENIHKEWVHFGEVVKGKPSTEVARLFSATLQLANAMNVELRHDGAMAIDTLHLKFLSSDRHHENIDDGEAFQQQKKKGKRKNH